MWLRRVGLIQSAIGRSIRRFEMKKKFDEFRSAASALSPISLPLASTLRHHPLVSSTVKSFMQTAGDTCFKSRWRYGALLVDVVHRTYSSSSSSSSSRQILSLPAATWRLGTQSREW